MGEYLLSNPMEARVQIVVNPSEKQLFMGGEWGDVCRCARERISNVARQPPAGRLQHTGQRFL